MDNGKRAGEKVKINPKIIEWTEKKIEEIISKSGYGRVTLIYYINNGKLDYIDKIAKETEKDRKNENNQNQVQGGGDGIVTTIKRVSGKAEISFIEE